MEVGSEKGVFSGWGICIKNVCPLGCRTWRLRLTMHTIRLRINDEVIDKVRNFLENLPKNEVEIVEESYSASKKKPGKKFKALSIETRHFKFDREEANAR